MASREMKRSWRGAAIGSVCLGAALALAACSSSPPHKSAADTTTTTTTTTLAPTTATTLAPTTTTVPPPTTTVPSGPACTMAAVSAGIPASSPDYGTLQRVTGFGCSGTWAYADIVGGTAQSASDDIVVLKASGASWTLADRASACTGGQLPASIQQAACSSD